MCSILGEQKKWGIKYFLLYCPKKSGKRGKGEKSLDKDTIVPLRLKTCEIRKHTQSNETYYNGMHV